MCYDLILSCFPSSSCLRISPFELLYALDVLSLIPILPLFMRYYCIANFYSYIKSIYTTMQMPLMMLRERSRIRKVFLLISNDWFLLVSNWRMVGLFPIIIFRRCGNRIYYCLMGKKLHMSFLHFPISLRLSLGIYSALGT